MKVFTSSTRHQPKLKAALLELPHVLHLLLPEADGLETSDAWLLEDKTEILLGGLLQPILSNISFQPLQWAPPCPYSQSILQSFNIIVHILWCLQSILAQSCFFFPWSWSTNIHVGCWKQERIFCFGSFSQQLLPRQGQLLRMAVGVQKSLSSELLSEEL